MLRRVAPRPRSRSASALSSSSASSLTFKALSTYTRARDSSAPMISNEGFSVVAPMNVSVPSSTCGKNASCWALLKRCTSSRNSTVGWPSAATCCACATASRMSLIPACTAESEMKCALERAAISRASVVLPVPGGPQRISECSAPLAIACYSGLPAASRCVWPTNSSSRRGRMRSASGRQPRAPSGRSEGCMGLRWAMGTSAVCGVPITSTSAGWLRTRTQRHRERGCAARG